MRIVLRAVAALMLVVGGIWVLQGLNVLPGSFMTGQIKWAGYGIATAIVGVALLVLSNRR